MRAEGQKPMQIIEKEFQHCEEDVFLYKVLD